MKIALFSDVHGHLRMVLHLIRNWQITHSTHLDAALIAGDLGCFPDTAKLDKATRRWLERDPEEAGFSKYFTSPQPEVERLLEPEFGEFSAVRCPILFVPGNHEDYDHIAVSSRRAAAASAPRDTFPVDCYERFSCIRDGTVIGISGGDGTHLQIAGVWGIENTRPGAPYKINANTIRKLQRKEEQFDLLLTHDAPAGAYPYGGSDGISNAIRTCQPQLHLFGHVHPINGDHEFSLPNCRTKSVIFKDTSFGKDGTQGLIGSIGILEWDGATSKVDLVSDDWLKQMHARNWEQILPECIPV